MKDKNPQENMTGDKMDVNAAEQLIAGAERAIFREDYTNEAGEESEKEKEDEKKE